MKNQLLHTPDGVRDIYNGECKKKLELQNNLLTSLHEFGYQDIQTPSFEYFDVFGNQIGTTPSRDLYKFFDKNGNTLVLRPDFTPSIARCAVKYYMDDDMPVKLCYMGNTFTNSSEYQGRFKEVTQCGAESIGDASIYADAEILAMTVDALKKSRLKEFQISVGHSQFFSGLIQAADIDEDTAEEFYYSLMHSCRATWSNCNRGAMAVLSEIVADSKKYEEYETEKNSYKDMLLVRANAFVEGAKECGLEILPYRDGFFISIPCDDPMKACEELAKENLYLVPLKMGLRFAVCAVEKSKCSKAPKLIKEVLDRI